MDPNIFMYAGGRPHPHKAPSASWLRRVAVGELEAVTDAEVLQEILHRYRSLRRWREGGALFDLARRIVPVVLPVTVETLELARLQLEMHDSLDARDAVHLAVCQLNGIEKICSYDRDFDPVEGFERIEPRPV
ncbi:MAG: type II toxin-antitoxin system VapC family toxin [Holophagales bacterium]|nr:type II toxin-antitoxin system VapC family toxin [Holophagales bacterium]